MAVDKEKLGFKSVLDPPFALALCRPGWLQTCYIAEGDLELPMFLLPLSVCGDGAQSLIHARQALYHLSPISSPSLFTVCCFSQIPFPGGT